MKQPSNAGTKIDRMYDQFFAKTGDPVAAATLTLAQVQAEGASPSWAAERGVLNPPDVAERLRVSPDTVHGWIRSGQLKASNLAAPGRRPRYKIRREDLDNFLAKRQPTTPPKPARRRRKSAPEERYNRY